FVNVAEGAYMLTVSAPGYEPSRQTVQVYTGVPITTAAIFVTKSKSGDGVKPALAPASDVPDITTMKDGFPPKAVQDFDKAMEEKNNGQTAKAIKLLEEAVQLAPGC